MKNKLYISDLDGTLLRDNAKLSDFSRENLNSLIENGLHFTVASARSVIAIQKILTGLNLRLPVIEFNGAFISDLKTGEHLIVNEINPDVKHDIFSDIKKHGHLPFLSSFNGKKDSLYYADIQNMGCNWYVNDRTKAGDYRLNLTDSLSKTMDEQIVCFTIIDKKERLEELSLDLKEKYGKTIEIYLMENDYSPGWYWLTIHDAKATKDQAIKELLKISKHNMDDLIVFGDNANDIKMFELATQAIAVENAKSILKEYATDIIGSNNEDSVVKYIIDDSSLISKISR